MRHPENPWLLPVIGWALLSVSVGLSYAKAHGWTGAWVLVALGGAAVVCAVGFAVVSVSLGWLLLRIAEARARSSKNNGGR